MNIENFMTNDSYIDNDQGRWVRTSYFYSSETWQLVNKFAKDDRLKYEEATPSKLITFDLTNQSASRAMNKEIKDKYAMVITYFDEDIFTLDLFKLIKEKETVE